MVTKSCSYDTLGETAVVLYNLYMVTNQGAYYTYVSSASYSPSPQANHSHCLWFYASWQFGFFLLVINKTE